MQNGGGRNQELCLACAKPEICSGLREEILREQLDTGTWSRGLGWSVVGVVMA